MAVQYYVRIIIPPRCSASLVALLFPAKHKLTCYFRFSASYYAILERIRAVQSRRRRCERIVSKPTLCSSEIRHTRKQISCFLCELQYEQSCTSLRIVLRAYGLKSSVQRLLASHLPCYLHATGFIGLLQAQNSLVKPVGIDS